MKQTTLLPCPFCEGPPSLMTAHFNGGYLGAEHIPSEGISAEAYVYCHECGAEGATAEGFVIDGEDLQNLEQQAVELWQSRTAKNRRLYDIGEKEGLNLYPRSEQGK